MGDGFSVYWNGGLVTPESGEYEFIVECRNGFKLYVNDATKPLIDQWVRSNDDLTHRQKVHLLGGRIYTLNLSLFQFEEKEVRIRLEWVTPSGIREAIPPEAFVPFGLREGLVISEPFPADDASDGYERGISVSEQWDSATTAAAIEAANWIASRIWKLARTKESADDRTEKVREFCVALVERAFVSPLSEEDKQFFVWQHFENELSIYDQVKRVVILALKSPRFLYPTLQQREAGYELAARTALALVDSVPDKLLLSKAAKGQLTNDDELSQQLDRMIEDPRSKQKLREFFHYWLKTEEATDATKDNEAFPDFDEHLIRDLQRSLDFYLDHVVWNDSSDFRNLFLADYLFVNQRIARFYNMEFGEPTNSGGSKADPEDGQESAYSGFKKIKVDPEHRSGILTHPFLMSGLAYHKDSSPIHRGVFVARRLLGRQLRQPPDDVKPLTEEFDLTMTTRQRVAYQTREKACMNCHSVINPLGFSLENFDAVGRFRTEEKQKPIDVTTVYKSRSGEEVKLSGARDLANYLVTNETAQKSFIAQLFRHYAKQPIHAYGEQILSDLHHKFVEHEFNIRILIREIVWVIVKHGYDEEVPDQSVSE